MVFLCLEDARQAECANALKLLSALDSSIPIVVLATVNDMELAKTAINFGAKGYIPSTANFEIAIEAVRFILAGGTYIPIDYLLASGPPAPSTAQLAPSANLLTDREISVVRAIQEGKSNKVIAYKLCICEGTVKVHLRNIMRKMKAKNRTEVAIKAQTSLAPDMSAKERDCRDCRGRRRSATGRSPDMPSARRFPREKPARQVGFTFPNTFRRRVARRRPLSRVSAGAPLRADDNGPKSPSRSRRLDSKTSNPTREPPQLCRVYD